VHFWQSLWKQAQAEINVQDNAITDIIASVLFILLAFLLIGWTQVILSVGDWTTH
jgi:hypothetical protein